MRMSYCSSIHYEVFSVISGSIFGCEHRMQLMKSSHKT